MDRVSIERMCAGKEFQVEDADTEKAREAVIISCLLTLTRRLIRSPSNLTYTALLNTLQFCTL